MLVVAHLHGRDGGIAVPEFGRHPHDLWIKLANAFRGARRHLELDIGDAERDAPEARGVRLITAYAIAPGTRRLDMIVVLAKGKFRAFQFLRDRGETVEHGLAARDEEPGMAPQHLRLAAWQMKLAPADIDPHIVVRRHQIGVTGKP